MIQPALDIVSISLLALGVGFFAAGTIGVLRFNSTLRRVHAVTKADTLGLGFVVGGLALRAGSASDVLLLLGIWVIALAAGAAAFQLVAREAHRGLVAPKHDSEAERGDG